MPKVSVIVPTYNRENLLKLALQSLQAQTSQDFEVIIMDNASKDGTRACVEELRSVLPNLRYIRQEVNIGPVANIAGGLELAQGQYVKYLLDDDLLHPDCIKVMGQCLDDYPQAALVTSKRTPIDENGNTLPDILATRRATAQDALLSGRELIEAVLSHRLNFIGEPSTVMFRKELVSEDFGIFNGSSFRINADIALWLQLLKKGDAIYLIKPLSSFRLHAGQDQRQANSEIIGSLEWMELTKQMHSKGYLQDDETYEKVLTLNMSHLQRLLAGLGPEQEAWRSSLNEETAWITIKCQELNAGLLAKRLLVVSKGNTSLVDGKTEPPILIIYPGLVEGFNSYQRGADWFNHGVGMISSVLKAAGHTIAYLDCRKLTGWQEAAELIKITDFQWALISVATVDFDASKRLAQLIKEKDAGIKIVVGGAHPSLMTEETAAVPEFDYIFTHEAEKTLPKLIKNPQDFSRIVHGQTPANLDRLPFVDRCLAPEGETPWFAEFVKPYFSITASRGCLYRCTFCQPAEREIFGHKVRKRSVDNVLDELEYLSKEYGMNSFMIHDDSFTQYPSWVEEFCRKKRERGLNQPFACQSRAAIICKHRGLIEQLRDVGLQWVLIGFESGSDRVLKFIKKDTTVRQNLEAARICKELGLKIFANYMFGLPTETNDEMRETALMMQTIKPEHYSPAVFTPAPGSELYTYCRERDLILINSSEGYRRNAGSGAKIKGVDYNYVAQMVALSMQPAVNEVAESEGSSELTVGEQPARLGKDQGNVEKLKLQTSIVIVTFNNLSMTMQCLESVFYTLAELKEKTEIIVVDNNSTDGTVAYLNNLSGQVKVICNQDNLGFAKACNQGAQLAQGKYLLFLNNDTVVSTDWLTQLLQPMQQREDIGLVGCKLLYPDGTVQHAGVGFTDLGGWLEPVHVFRGYERFAPEVTAAQEVQAVTGACFAIRRRHFLELGMLDEGYINGLEDIDLCLKVHQSGLKVYYQPSAEVIHLESQSPGRFAYAGQNIARFRDKWEKTGWAAVDTELVEGVYCLR